MSGRISATPKELSAGSALSPVGEAKLQSDSGTAYRFGGAGRSDSRDFPRRGLRSRQRREPANYSPGQAAARAKGGPRQAAVRRGA